MHEISEAPPISVGFITASISLLEGLIEAAMADLGDCLKHWRNILFTVWLEAVYSTANYLQRIRI